MLRGNWGGGVDFPDAVPLVDCRGEASLYSGRQVTVISEGMVTKHRSVDHACRSGLTSRGASASCMHRLFPRLKSECYLTF